MAEEATHRERLIPILVNNRPVDVPRETTGLQIKEAAAVPAEFTLYLRRGTTLDEIGNQQHETVHDGEQFVAVSGQDVS